MPLINPVDALLWTFRRDERDVVRMYSALTGVMTLATGGRMLNFGCWTAGAADPISAQENLCRVVAEMAELGSAKVVVDAGSGLGAPAALWGKMHGVQVICVNTNCRQLSGSEQDDVWPVCSSAGMIPVAGGAADRVVALESAQHFRPLGRFVSESGRILAGRGLLVMAVPVVTDAARGLGILKFTWSSEHYNMESVRDSVKDGGFEIVREERIGDSVYAPLADYYERERVRLRARILERYPSYVESVLYRSMRRMRRAYEEGAIDYILLKCRPS